MECLVIYIDNLGYEPLFSATEVSNNLELVVTKVNEDLNITINKEGDLQSLFTLSSPNLKFKSFCNNNIIFNIKAVNNETVLSIYNSTQNLILDANKINESVRLTVENKCISILVHSKVLDIIKLMAIFSLLCNITPLEPLYLRSLDDDKLIDSFERVLISLK